MANVVLEMTGDDVKAFRSLSKLEAKVQELEGKLREAGVKGGAAGDKIAGGADRAGTSLDKAGKSGREAFGDSALRTLTGYIGGVASLGAAVALVNKALEETKRVANEAGQRVGQAFGDTIRLLQVSTSPQEYEGLMAEVRKLRTTAGIDQSAAAQAVFLAKSAGVTGDLGTFAKLSRIGLPLDAAIGGYQKTMANFPKAGSVPEVINTWLAAAASSPVGAGEMAKGMTQMGAPWAAIGGSNEEALAALAVMSKVFKSPDVAAERIGSLAMKVGNLRERGQLGFGEWSLPTGAFSKVSFPSPIGLAADQIRRLRGLSPVSELGGTELINALPGLAALGATRGPTGERQGLAQWLGDAGAITAAQQFVVQRRDIAATRRDIDAARAATGKSGDLLDNMLSIFASRPELANELAARTAEQKTQITQEDRYSGLQQLRRRAIAITERDYATMSRSSQIAARVADTASRFIEGMFYSEDTQVEFELQRARSAEQRLNGPAAPEAAGMRAELQRIRRTLESIDRKANRSPTLRQADEDR